MGGIQKLLFIVLMALGLISGSLASAQDMPQAHLGETAHIVPVGKLWIGLRQLSYGLSERIEVETLPLYALLGSWSIFAKAKIIDIDPISVAGRAGFFYMTLEALPEVEHSRLLRYYLGGILSIRMSEDAHLHFNISNTSLQGDKLSQQFGMKVIDDLTNLGTDFEYRLTESRRIFIGTGYNVSNHKFSLGGSHQWDWSQLYLKLGMTFKMARQNPLNLLPYLDLGIRL